ARTWDLTRTWEPCMCLSGRAHTRTRPGRWISASAQSPARGSNAVGAWPLVVIASRMAVLAMAAIWEPPSTSNETDQITTAAQALFRKLLERAIDSEAVLASVATTWRSARRDK